MNAAIKDSGFIDSGFSQMLRANHPVFDRKWPATCQFQQPTVDRGRFIAGTLPEAHQTGYRRQAPAQLEHTRKPESSRDQQLKERHSIPERNSFLNKSGDSSGHVRRLSR
jgi:hypothetical protein